MNQKKMKLTEASFCDAVAIEDGTGKRPTKRSKIQDKGKRALRKMGKENSAKGSSGKVLQWCFYLLLSEVRDYRGQHKKRHEVERKRRWQKHLEMMKKGPKIA